jgi:alkylation response protein AidB-like acyl-CoA dehydrogenase
MGSELRGSRLGYSDGQLELMDSLTTLLDEHCSPSVARSMIEDISFTADGAWNEMVKAGWTSTLYAESVGGQGLGMAEMSALLVAAGRVLLPGPFFSSAVLTPLALKAAGVTGSDLTGIKDVAAGHRVASVALAEGPTVFPALSVETTVRQGRISGVKHFVLDANRTDYLLVLARDTSGRLGFAWVPSQAPEVEVLVHPAIDGRRHCTVTLNQARAAAFMPMPGDESAPDLLQRAAVMTASLQIGGSESALALAVAYAQTRVQFGRPIGAFQAISHRLVDLYCSLSIARALVQKAIRSADHELFTEAASRAKICANDTYRNITKGALQTFGGIGFTFEHDIHLYLRSAFALGSEFGNSAHHRTLLQNLARSARNSAG